MVIELVEIGIRGWGCKSGPFGKATFYVGCHVGPIAPLLVIQNSKFKMRLQRSCKRRCTQKRPCGGRMCVASKWPP